MSLNLALGILGAVTAVIGVWLAVYYGRREGRRQKKLVYQSSLNPWPIASSTTFGDHNLTLMYETQGAEARRVEDAFIQIVRFANLGHESIRGGDIARANPLRIEVEGAELLDAAIEAVTRDVACIELGTPTAEASTASIPISFDYLDHEDGAVIRLLTTSRPTRVSVRGDLVGMPQGIKSSTEAAGRRAFWGTLGAILAVLFVGSALAAVVIGGRLITETWWSAVLIPLGILALVGPLVLAILISDHLWPSSRPTFPRALFSRNAMHLGGHDYAYVEGPDGSLMLHPRRLPPRERLEEADQTASH